MKSIIKYKLRHHAVDSIFLEPDSGVLHRSDRKALVEEEEPEPAFHLQQDAFCQRRHTALSDISCSDSSNEVWEESYLLLKHHLKNYQQRASEATHCGHGSNHQDTALAPMSLKQKAHRTASCTSQRWGRQLPPGSLRVSVPLCRTALCSLALLQPPHPSLQYYCLTGLHLNYRPQTNLQS